MYAAKIAAATLALAGSSFAARVCDAATSICYNDFTTANAINFRIAIPDNATNTAPYDILLSITAPKSVGWAGIAWGGSMTNNPLTLAWSNGTTGAVASSKRATMKMMPSPFTGETLVVLRGSTTNATHWKLDALCTGCSTWNNQANQKVQINPGATAQSIAWASSLTKPTTPTNKDSNIAKHEQTGAVSFNFNAAKLANFTSLVTAYRTGVKPATL